MHHSCANDCSPPSLVLHSATTQVISFNVSFLTKTLVRMRIWFKYECKTKKWEGEKKGEKLLSRNSWGWLKQKAETNCQRQGVQDEEKWQQESGWTASASVGAGVEIISSLLLCFLSLHYHVLCFLLSDKLSGVQHQQKLYSSLNSAPHCRGT